MRTTISILPEVREYILRQLRNDETQFCHLVAETQFCHIAGAEDLPFLVKMIRNEDNERLRLRGRTSICQPTLLSMGTSPRTAPNASGDGGERRVTTPRTRYARDYFPPHSQVLALLLRCVPNSYPQSGSRAEMEARFRDVKDAAKLDRAEAKLCKTSLRWIEHALGARYHVTQMDSLNDVFAGDSAEQTHLMEFFLFDVILNRAVKLADTDGVADPDKVVKALAYNDDDIDQRSDRKYRSAIAFLPRAGVFYCARERRKSNCEDTLRNSLVPLDISWLRITRADDNLLKFGEDGYVRYFAGRCPKLPVSGWRVTAGRGGQPQVLHISGSSVCRPRWSTDAPRYGRLS